MHSDERRFDTRRMAAAMSGLCSPPRILVAGRARDPLQADAGGFAHALGRVMPVRTIDASATPTGMLRLLRAAGAAVGGDGYEALHLLDARLTPAALLLRARFGLPVTVVLTAADVPLRRPSAVLRLVGRLDQAFATDGGVAERLAARLPGLAVSITRRVASPPAEPSARALASLVRLLRDVTPGRLVLAVPWPEDRVQVRWLRDAVVPLLHGKPLVLLVGAPSRREARLLAGPMGLQGTYRVHTGALDGDVIAAAARCADVFVVPAGAKRARDVDSLLQALTASGVPVVVGGGVRGDALEHERNAFVADAEDPMKLVSLLNDLLALPAVQRHYLGEEFAAHTLQRWSWDEAIGAYAARFASLVGRPQIPTDLRAAA
jgi:hypothetical protein